MSWTSRTRLLRAEHSSRSSRSVPDAAFEHSLAVNEKARGKANASYARKPLDRVNLGACCCSCGFWLLLLLLLLAGMHSD